jgi:DNA-binding HxlR family transcriptional regulator
MRFSRLREVAEGVSQKMLTKTLRQLERDGLVTRYVHLVIPPRVVYQLTPLGRSLLNKICEYGTGSKAISVKWNWRDASSTCAKSGSTTGVRVKCPSLSVAAVMRSRS